MKRELFGIPWVRLQSVAALLIMIVILSVTTNAFLTADNAWNILRQISVNLCLSIGMTLVVVSGGIDLSVGAVLGLSGVVAARLIKAGMDLPGGGWHLEVTVSGAIAVALLVGSCFGLFNGFAVTYLRLAPFVATLAMLSIARGFAFLWTGGFPVTGLPAGFNFMGSGRWLGVPVPVWIVGALTILAAAVVRFAVFGRQLYAVGGSERAALLSGVRVDRIRIAVYGIAGALAGIAGLLVTARLDSAQPNAGLGYELDSIAAVVIGGASLSGGFGSISGGARLSDHRRAEQQAVPAGRVAFLATVDQGRGDSDIGGARSARQPAACRRGVAPGTAAASTRSVLKRQR
jgi:ribose transport system permease protein